MRCLSTGDARRAQRLRWAVRSEDLEEGCGDSGWWCGMHYGGEESSRSLWQTTLPHPAPLLLSDHGTHHTLSVLSRFTYVWKTHYKPMISCVVAVCRTVFTLWWSISTVEIWCIKYNKWENLRNPMLCMYSLLKHKTVKGCF